MNDMIVNTDKFQAMILSCDKKENQYDFIINNLIIISSVDSVTPLGIEIGNKINFEKHVSTIISIYMFSSRQYNLLYIYLYTINVFKYLFLLSKNIKSYLYYYYIKVLRFSLDPLPQSSSLPL